MVFRDQQSSLQEVKPSSVDNPISHALEILNTSAQSQVERTIARKNTSRLEAQTYNLLSLLGRATNENRTTYQGHLDRLLRHTQTWDTPPKEIITRGGQQFAQLDLLVPASQESSGNFVTSPNFFQRILEGLGTLEGFDSVDELIAFLDPLPENTGTTPHYDDSTQTAKNLPTNLDGVTLDVGNGRQKTIKLNLDPTALGNAVDIPDYMRKVFSY